MAVQTSVVVADLADGGDFSADFTAAAPNTYDHSTGGGAFNDRTVGVNDDVVESLQGGDFACSDVVTFLTQVTVDAGATGTQTIELDFAFLADSTGQSGVAIGQLLGASINYGPVQNGAGPGGIDGGINDDGGTPYARTTVWHRGSVRRSIAGRHHGRACRDS